MTDTKCCFLSQWWNIFRVTGHLCGEFTGDRSVCSGADIKKHQFCVTGLCDGNSPVTGEFPAHRASDAENASIWWRHHGTISLCIDSYMTAITRHQACVSLRRTAWKLWDSFRCIHGFVTDLVPWWRHQLEPFSSLLAICVGNSPVTGEFHAQRPVTESFDDFFDKRLNKRLSK